MTTTAANRLGPCVREVMTARVCTLELDDSIYQAARLFEHERFHHVVVLERGRIVGVVSDRDILKTLSPFLGQLMMERPQDLATMRKRIHQIMTRKPVTVRVDQSTTEAARMMLDQRVSCLPVVDDKGALAGIVTIRDLITQLAGSIPDDAVAAPSTRSDALFPVGAMPSETESGSHPAQRKS